MYTTEIATEFNYPNLTIFKILNNGVQYGWRIVSNEGYVMYDINGVYYDYNPETMEEFQVMHYFTSWDLPMNYNFNNFHWAAKLRSEVDENYIFGDVDNESEHEIM